MHGKYSTRGGVEWQIQYEAKPNAVFARDHIPTTALKNWAISVPVNLYLQFSF